MKRGVKALIVILIIAIIIAVITIVCNKDDTELKTVKSKQELLKIYEGDNSDLQELLARIFCMPFSITPLHFLSKLHFTISHNN